MGLISISISSGFISIGGGFSVAGRTNGTLEATGLIGGGRAVSIRGGGQKNQKSEIELACKLFPFS